MMHLRATTLAVAITAALFAAACSDDDGAGDLGSPGAGSSPTAGVTFVPTSDPLEYPLEVADMLGRTVTLERAPEQIGAAGALPEQLLRSLGVVPFAVDAAGSLDDLRDADVDLILLEIEGADPDPASLDGDPPVIALRVRGFEGVLAAVAITGQAVDRRAEAEQAQASLRNALTVAQTRIPPDLPRALMLLDIRRGVSVATEASYAGDMLRQLGAVNAMAAPTANADQGFVTVSREAGAATEPQVILVLADEGEGEAAVAAVRDDPAFASTPAVTAGHVVALPAALFFDSPGLRVRDALDALAAALYPEVFG